MKRSLGFQHSISFWSQMFEIHIDIFYNLIFDLKSPNGNPTVRIRPMDKNTSFGFQLFGFYKIIVQYKRFQKQINIKVLKEMLTIKFSIFFYKVMKPFRIVQQNYIIFSSHLTFFLFWKLKVFYQLAIFVFLALV